VTRFWWGVAASEEVMRDEQRRKCSILVQGYHSRASYTCAGVPQLVAGGGGGGGQLGGHVGAGHRYRRTPYTTLYTVKVFLSILLLRLRIKAEEEDRIPRAFLLVCRGLWWWRWRWTARWTCRCWAPPPAHPINFTMMITLSPACYYSAFERTSIDSLVPSCWCAGVSGGGGGGG
jgi:hypothetical protein